MKTYYIAYTYLSFGNGGWAYGDTDRYTCEGEFHPWEFKKWYCKVQKDEYLHVVILNVIPIP